jgi:nitrate reductase gamma subunit
MGDYVHSALFGVYPYVAIAVFLLGSLLRFDTDQYGWRSKSSQFLRRKQLVAGSILFHVGILGILGGHAVGLLTPVAIFDAVGISHGFKQGLAIVAGGIFGTACMIGLLLLIHAFARLPASAIWRCLRSCSFSSASAWRPFRSASATWTGT